MLQPVLGHSLVPIYFHGAGLGRHGTIMETIKHLVAIEVAFSHMLRNERAQTGSDIQQGKLRGHRVRTQLQPQTGTYPVYLRSCSSVRGAGCG